MFLYEKYQPIALAHVNNKIFESFLNFHCIHVVSKILSNQLILLNTHFLEC